MRQTCLRCDHNVPFHKAPDAGKVFRLRERRATCVHDDALQVGELPEHPHDLLGEEPWYDLIPQCQSSDTMVWIIWYIPRLQEQHSIRFPVPLRMPNYPS